MRIHNPFVTGSLTVSGSKGVDFTDATKGVSGSFSGSFEVGLMVLLTLVM